MQKKLDQNKSSGFAAIKLMLIAIIIILIGGVLVYVFIQRSSIALVDNNGGTSNNASKTVIYDGSTSSITTLTEQDAQIEAGVDSEFDGLIQQNVSSADSAASNLGGAYDAGSF